MQKKLSELRDEVERLGLTVVKKGKRESKDDYISALRAHYLVADGIQNYEELHPMLCFSSDNLKEDERKALWTDRNWIAEEKLNGARLVLHAHDTGYLAQSRNISVKNYRRATYTDHLLFRDRIPPHQFVVDCEVIQHNDIDTRPYTTKGEKITSQLHATTSTLALEASSSVALQKEQGALTFYAFDLVSLEGKSLKSQPLRVRRRLLERLKLNHPDLPFEVSRVSLSQTEQHKRDLWRNVCSEDGEGLVFKNLTSRYVDSSSRSRKGWVKMKRRCEVDAFVTGSIPGGKGTGWEHLIGALEFSVYLRKSDGEKHIVAYCSNLTMEQREKLTVKVDGKPQVHPQLLGKVAEVSGQEFSARSHRLSHAIIERWRIGADAKSKEDCVLHPTW